VRVGEGTVAVIVGVFEGVGVGWVATVIEHPLARFKVKPKEFAGTIPGQAASTLRNVKVSESVSPASRSSSLPKPPGLVHVVGEDA
jgi:hypothetical protein